VQDNKKLPRAKRSYKNVLELYQMFCHCTIFLKYIYGAKYSNMVQNVRGASCPWGEISWGELSIG
jgi:hypothetical protein